jgi:hypothetical protein
LPSSCSLCFSVPSCEPRTSVRVVCSPSCLTPPLPLCSKHKSLLKRLRKNVRGGWFGDGQSMGGAGRDGAGGHAGCLPPPVRGAFVFGPVQKKAAPENEKPAPVKTHLRNMVIIPEMIGSVIGVYNGKVFLPVEVKVCDSPRLFLEWAVQLLRPLRFLPACLL